MASRDPDRHEDPAASSAPARRRQWWIAALLVATTAAAGVAARMGPSGAPASGGTGDPTPLRFAAPGGGPVAFSARLDREAVMEDGDGTVMMELLLHAGRAPDAPPVRTPTALVVVLDRSGSMQGEAMDHARASARELMARLGPDDRFALVSYADDARIDIPLDPPTGERPDLWRARLESIAARGGTNMARGLDLADRIAAGARAPGRSVRVILISDGHANQGDHSLEGLRARAARAVPGEFVLSAVGVGDGFDERLMTALADAGTGNFYYVPDVEELASVFGDEFLSARETVARALAVSVETGDGVTLVDAAGYPIERAGAASVVRPGALFAGQERRLWLTLRVAPERRARADGPVELGRVALHYSGIDETRHTAALGPVPRVQVVQRADDFYAAIDVPAYAAQLATDGLGSLRQRVAEAVRSGEADRARFLIDEFEREELGQLRALGYAVEKHEASGAIVRMRDDVDAALAPAAPAGAANELGKALSSEGHDARRAGAKRRQAGGSGR